MSTLLPFHTQIITELHDPATSELVVLSRGLGLRRILCMLMKIYNSPQSLVLIINAKEEEEAEIAEELHIIGCRKPSLKTINFESGTSKHRRDIYKSGGLVSVTARILVVDMLLKDIPIDLITGIIVLHAEQVSPTHLVSFITRLYRDSNEKGFLKAFTDQPEHITSGLSPLKNIMKELRLRKVHIYPRFHEDIKKVLERKRADVVELSQHLTEPMKDIHDAVVQCINATLAELRRSRSELDLDMLTLPAAYFPAFDRLVRKQLDPVWTQVGSTTKALISDLRILRQLVTYLLSYDSVQFHTFCEMILESSNEGKRSPWLMSDAANTIFQTAKRRCFTLTAPMIDEHQDDLDVLDEMEGSQRPKWLPRGMDPMLEELPKWSLLAEVLEEIEGEIVKIESDRSFRKASGTNTTLVMTSSTASGKLLEEFLAKMDQDKPKGQWGRRLMLQKLKTWLYWKNRNAKDAKSTYVATSLGAVLADSESVDNGLDEALKKKDRERADKRAKRRRLRGGAPGTSRQPSVPPSNAPISEDTWNYGELHLLDDAESFQLAQQLTTFNETDFDDFGLLTPEETVMVRAYSDDTDDRMLDEIKPRFIVMMEPCMEFIRRVEVYKSSNPGLAVRVYHMVYADSCEEHKYLAGIRREKESFERLIKERGSMLLPILEDRRSTATDAAIKTLSTRVAGGRRELSNQRTQVIVDMREFRSSLPALLYAANVHLEPATLTVGDYILTPDICVERKSLSDLVSSFNSGRLYTQCEAMSVHYKNPVLLIEFEEDKAFSLELVSDIKQYGKAQNRLQNKGKASAGKNSEFEATKNAPSIQSKIVLLSLTFPRVRIIWSSSPYTTAEIFKDLKMDRAEPDPAKAIATGAEEDPEAGAGVNTAAEELLRSLPGVTAKNVKYVMSKVNNVREFCELDLKGVQDILGIEPGKACYQFMHRGDR